MTQTENLGGESILLERGTKAVLFIHGFTSTTQAVLPTGEILAEAGFTVSMPLLPGSTAGLVSGDLWRNPVSPDFVAIVP